MSHGTISDCYSRLASCGKLDYTNLFFFFFFFLGGGGGGGEGSFNNLRDFKFLLYTQRQRKVLSL